ncbi:MAG TPA: AI-2E family transporter [Sphingobium sp.]|nr:AI-2E family transporter [Sphingobium sp.]
MSSPAPPPPPDRRAYWARLIVVGLLLLLGLWIAKNFIAALIWALVIAIALDPLYLRLRARYPGRVLLPALVTAAVALIILVPLIAGIAQAAIEARQVASWIAAARANGVPPPDWLAHLPFGAPALTQWWQAHLASPQAATLQLHSLTGGGLIEHSRLIGINVLHRAVIFVFTLLTLFFLLRDRDAIIAQISRAGDRLLGPTGERIGRQAIRSVRGTIDGLILVGMGEGAVMTVVYILLGTPHPLLLGVLTAVAATIPFGALVMFVIAAILLLGAGAVMQAITVVAVGLVVVGVADHFVRPALIGGATRLPFLWVLIGILGGAETLGVLGLFVGPAIMAVLIMLWRDFTGDPARTPPAIR